jgi:hypothetical protein
MPQTEGLRPVFHHPAGPGAGVQGLMKAATRIDGAGCLKMEKEGATAAISISHFSSGFLMKGVCYERVGC